MAEQLAQNQVGTSPRPEGTKAGYAPYQYQGRGSGIRRGMHNPPHTSTESTMAPTSEFTRYFLLALPARYTLRGGVGALFDPNFGAAHNHSWINRPFRPLRRAVDSLVDHHLTDRLASKIDALLGTHRFTFDYAQDRRTIEGDTIHGRIYYQAPTTDMVNDALKMETGKALQSGIQKAAGKWGGIGDMESLLHGAYDRERLETNKGVPRLSDETRKQIRQKIMGNLGSIGYGATLGIGSTALTASYSRMVYRDIMNLFRESVALEFDKDPEDVRFADIRKSQNAIVQSTVANWFGKTFSRLSTDSLFFASAATKNSWMVDLALGVKGVQLLYETWQRKPTIFEQLTTLVNQKLNPQNGLGQPITVGDVFDLYQHYSTQHAPQKTFRSVIETDPVEGLAWQQGRPVFQRIAELLNLTYTYKHDVPLDGNGAPIRQADFALPKFIYLLGHNLIDPYKPKESLLYIEAMNHHGAKAVKEIRSALAQGVPVDALIPHYLGSPTLAAHMQAAHRTPNPVPPISVPTATLAPQTDTHPRHIAALHAAPTLQHTY